MKLRLAVLIGTALYLSHFFIPFREATTSPDLEVVGDEVREVSRTIPSETLAGSGAEKPLFALMMFTPAFLILSFAGGAAWPSFAKELSGLAGVLAAVSAIITFGLVVLISIAVLIGLSSSEGRSRIAMEPGAFSAILGITVILLFSSYVARMSARLPISERTSQVKFFLCHAAVLLAGVPLMEIVVVNDRLHAAPLLTLPFWVGGLSWCTMLAGVLAIAKHARSLPVRSA
ncbi:MAG TPA: hypothetical protein VF950_09715 [Planctomycetota bacterium]